MKWEEVRQLHASTADAVADAASSIPPSAWLVPRAEGKWSPAEEVQHLLLTYDTVQRELEGGPGMKVLTKWWQRLLLRLFLVPKLLRGGPFPKNARAPREVRPVPPAGTQDETVALLRARALEFEKTADAARHRGASVTHAYFGTADVTTGVLLCTRHMQHHLARLASDSQRLPPG